MDLTKILKDCPKGAKLYSTVYGDVYFQCVGGDDSEVYCINFKQSNGKIQTVTADGKHLCGEDGECTLFPSKDQRDWSKWQRPFEDGDILSYQNKFYNNRTIYIYKYHRKMNTSYYVALSGSSDSDFMINNKYGCALDNYNDTARFATEEEKQKLFDAIKANGYRWNAETRTLEKLIVPKFKVGDTIQSKFDNNDKFTITNIGNIDNNEFYYGCGKNGCGKMCEFMIPVVKQDNWILIPNKFDPKTLQPFDKVLVRDYSGKTWVAAFFSHISDLTSFFNKFVTVAGRSYKQMIPYNEETKYLLGTNNEAPEKYINW